MGKQKTRERSQGRKPERAMILRLFQPNSASFGYGLFLALNATSVWGGGFPLLPMEFQTFSLLTRFFLVQSTAFGVALLICLLGAWYYPRLTQRMPILGCVALLFLGSLSLIAPLYLPEYMSPLVTVGGLFLGVGSALFFVLWQRVFAAQDADEGKLNLIIGTGYSALLYTILHVIPLAVAAFMIAFIFIPLVGLCLILATRQIDYRQPMFEDVPRLNAPVYRQTVRNQWRSALCVGCFGFMSGIARALALVDPSMGTIVNFVSMAGALISALVLIFLWTRYTFTFNTVLSFRTIFPLIVTSFLILPFLTGFGLRLFAGLMYMFFIFASMIMMIQCAQTSRDYGISPFFIYSFFGMISFMLQSLGFLIGNLSAPAIEPGFAELSIIALFSVWFLAMTLYLVRGHLRGSAVAELDYSRAGGVEFLALEQAPAAALSELDFAEHVASPEVTGPEAAHNDRHFRDRVSKLCLLLAKQYRLTARETEVMELLARGNSVAHIAKTLIVSENTIRTHSKRLYVKLNIHKRQDLLVRLDEIDETMRH
ncbi:MAG: helix-turn-helix transcriptional regulator [Coriobacteriales bacterium]|jgi:DNA-binding CsgD family transcriptional regulator|nr:helix-turn-helix transcriptional regulator [Coriobacteriales bacterium]